MRWFYKVKGLVKSTPITLIRLLIWIHTHTLDAILQHRSALMFT